jgi:hypothetical protein
MVEISPVELLLPFVVRLGVHLRKHPRFGVVHSASGDKKGFQDRAKIMNVQWDFIEPTIGQIFVNHILDRRFSLPSQPDRERSPNWQVVCARSGDRVRGRVGDSSPYPFIFGEYPLSSIYNLGNADDYLKERSKYVL